MREIMFDLETLDVRPSAVVLSIGAVAFDSVTGVVAERFCRVLDIQEQLDRGRTISQHTLLWWMQQGPMARSQAFAEERPSVGGALSDFLVFCRPVDHPDMRYWCKGPSFDGVIWDSLASNFIVAGFKAVPWQYNQLRDVRTIVDLAGYSEAEHVTRAQGAPHDPVYDCEFQVEVVQVCRRILQGGRVESYRENS